jgi:uncharacterized membrane protein
MTHAITTALLWFSAIGCGLLAGVYFSFSTLRPLARVTKRPAPVRLLPAVRLRRTTEGQ